MYKKVPLYCCLVLGILAVCAECFYIGNNEVDVAPNEGMMARFFRWLGFVRPPIFGFSHYNHFDFGEPGELQNGIGIRLGPKPNEYFENGIDHDYEHQPLRAPSW